MRYLHRHLTYANVVATLALFLGLGGAAWAVNELPAKSVGARQLRPGAVTARKLRKNAVSAPKIEASAVKNGKLADGSVTERKLGNGSVTTSKLADGSTTASKIAANAVGGAQIDEASLGEVPSAKASETAQFAESANPSAFAAVSQEGNVDPALSKGAIDVSIGSEGGIYCVTVPAFAPRGAQVTPRYNGSGGVTAFVTIGGTGSCPSPEIEVQTFNSGARVKEPFYIVLYR
jgi:hypothetical protein